MSMKKQVLITLGIAAGAIALLGYAKYVMIAKAIVMHSFQPPPESVTSFQAIELEWPRTLSATGSLMPVQGVTLSVEEAGKVSKINFESGKAVQKGDLLVELDASVEEARLKGAQAQLENARRSLTRIQNLRATNAMSADSLDKADYEFKQADAEVQSIQASIARKRVVAPFTGRAGIRAVNLGQYLTPGQPVVPLHAVDPIYLNFSLPQQSAALLSEGQLVHLKVDAYGDNEFDGKVSAVNPQIDDKTRTVEVQATVPNPDEKLRPGMWGNIEVVLPNADRFVVLPVTSISYAPYGDSVYVIEAKRDESGKETKTLRQQIVKTGPRKGDQIAILSGIKAGEEVVTSGLFKLRPGAAVVVNNDFAPSSSADPKPTDS
jgi:membrane fusion protein (multidrug efflux system)